VVPAISVKIKQIRCQSNPKKRLNHNEKTETLSPARTIDQAIRLKIRDNAFDGSETERQRRAE
jgi:hypothetical protein